MIKYFTGLIPFDVDIIFSPPYKGRGWEINIENSYKRKTHSDELEIVIYAKDHKSAKRVYDLIIASLVLSQGEALPFRADLTPFCEEEIEKMNEVEMKAITNPFMQTSSIPLACSIAAKASNKAFWVYSITKYYFSISLFSIAIMDLEPHRSRYFGVSANPYEQITMVYATLSAYSVIEELGLEIRASMKNPSRINGKWNEKVKQDLEIRLLKSKINITEPLVWMTRGPKRKLDNSRPLEIKSKAPWSGFGVNDSEIELIDAIAYADWFRDKIIAHKVRVGLTTTIKPYDVLNIQFLSRRLLLESLGFWNAL